MTPYLVISRFQMSHVLGVGSSGLVWQIERRAGRKGHIDINE